MVSLPLYGKDPSFISASFIAAVHFLEGFLSYMMLIQRSFSLVITLVIYIHFSFNVHYLASVNIEGHLTFLPIEVFCLTLVGLSPFFFGTFRSLV